VTSRRGGLGGCLAAVAVAAIALLAPAASASTATISGSTLFVKGAAGEKNTIQVGYAPLGGNPVLVVSDIPGPNAGVGCSDFAQTAICTARGIKLIQIETRDGNDTILIDDQVPKTPTRILAGSGSDQIRGSRGNDWIDGGTGADSITGLAGTDTAAYNERTTPVTIKLGQSRASGNADDGAVGARDSIGADVENAKGGSAADRIFGTDARNYLIGGIGSDLIRGGRGDDLIRGRIDSDTVFGGAGRDLVFGGHGSDLLRGGNGRDRERGGLGADRVRGGPGADKLRGGPGSDQVNGLQGDDRIWGGFGSDGLLGQTGLDHIFADDNDVDAKINCGPGNGRRESAVVDQKDPRPVSC
jgi:Ca2+-binding RTX toxin-like protein